MSAFDKLLGKVSIEEYQAFIRHCATNDPDFKSAFEIYFAEKGDHSDLADKYTRLVQRIISNYSDRGYVHYNSSFALFHEIDNLLQSGANLANKNNFRDSFIIARVTLREMIEVITCCDDSSGNIGGCVSEAIQLIETVADADDAAPALKEEIFSFLEKEIQDPIYFDYGDYGYDLFDTYRSLAAHLGKGEAFLTFTDKKIAQEGTTDYYSNYHREFLIKQKIRFFQEINDRESAQQLIAQHMDIVDVRKEEVNRVLSEKNVQQAKILIREGIRIARGKDHPGTVSQWERELLRVAELENDVSTIRHYAKRFAFDQGFGKEDYNKWKSTYSPDEWEQVIEQLIREKTEQITSQKSEVDHLWGYNMTLTMVLAPILFILRRITGTG